MTKVRGRFSEFDRVIDYDEQQPEDSTMNATIQAASIDLMGSHAR